jgi:hypothetical protein
MNPQQFNRYSYVLNNPLRFTDPTGHCAGDPGAIGECYGHSLEDFLVRQVMGVAVQIKIGNSFSHGVIINNNTILTHYHFDQAKIDIFSVDAVSVYDVAGNELCLPCNLTAVATFHSRDGDVLDLSELIFADNPFPNQPYVPAMIVSDPLDLPGQNAIAISYYSADVPSGSRSEFFPVTITSTAFNTRDYTSTPTDRRSLFTGLEVDHTFVGGVSGGPLAATVNGKPVVIGINSATSGNNGTGYVTFPYR